MLIFFFPPGAQADYRIGESEMPPMLIFYFPPGAQAHLRLENCGWELVFGSMLRQPLGFYLSNLGPIYSGRNRQRSL